MSYEALKKRYDQGWLLEMVDDVEELIRVVRKAKREKRATSIGFHGNAVTVWERFARELEATGELLVELGSDQVNSRSSVTLIS